MKACTRCSEATGLYIYEIDYCVKVQLERDAALARVTALTDVLNRIPLSTQTAAMQREMQKAVRGG